MANNPSENPANQKIWQFENVEALAEALEQQQLQNHADKVRNIWTEAARDTSKLARDILNSELNITEQQDIIRALPNKWLETVLKKREITAQWTVVLPPQVANNPKEPKKDFSFDSILLFFDKFANAWEIYEKVSKAKWDGLWWMLAWIGAFLAYLFKWKLPEIEWVDWSFWPKPQKKPEENKPWGSVEGRSENVDISKKRITWMIISKFWWLEKDTQIKVWLIYNDNKINKLSFDEIKSYYNSNKNNNNFWQDLWTNHNKEDIKNAYKLLVEKEDFIDWILKNIDPNWRQKSIWEIFIMIYPDIEWIQKITEVKSLDDLKDKFNFWEIKLLDWKNKEADLWWFDEKYNKLKKDYKWLTPNVLSYTKTTIKDITFDSNIDLENQLDLNNEEKDFLKKLKDFWEKINNLIINNYNLWLNDEFNKLKKLTYSEIIDLFIITWWKTEWFNSLEKSYIYLKITKILSSRGENQLLWNYYSKLLEKINDNTDISIPKDVKDIIKWIFWDVSSIVFEWLKWKADILLWIMEANPIKSAWVIILLWVFLYLTKWVGLWFFIKSIWVTAIITAITTAWLLWKDDSRLRQIEKELNNLKSN